MRRPSLGAIFLTIVLDLLGFGLVLPFLAEEARDNFHTTAFVGAVLGATSSLMEFFFVPVWGRLSDRIGRRPILVGSVAASALSMLGLGLALAYGNSVVWLFAARILSGMASANIGTASAYIADITKPEDRARGMSLIGLAFGVGFILGPALGGLLAKIEVNGHFGSIPCFVAAAFSTVNFVWVLLGLPESLPKERRATVAPRSLAPLSMAALRDVLARKDVARAIFVNFLILLAFTNLDMTLRYFNKDLFGMDQLATGLLITFIGVVAAFVVGALIPPLSRRFTDATLIRAGTAIQAAAFLTFVVAPDFGTRALYVAGALLGIGNALTQPTVSAYVSKRSAEHEQGEMLGMNQSMASLARVFGPAFGGYVYGAFGPRSPFVAGTLGMLIALLFAVRLQKEPSRIARVA